MHLRKGTPVLCGFRRIRRIGFGQISSIHGLTPFPFFQIAAQHVWKTQSAEIHAHEKESGQTDRSLGGINLSAGFLTLLCRVQFLGQIFAATADLLTILSRVQVFSCRAVMFSCFLSLFPSAKNLLRPSRQRTKRSARMETVFCTFPKAPKAPDFPKALSVSRMRPQSALLFLCARKSPAELSGTKPCRSAGFL